MRPAGDGPLTAAPSGEHRLHLAHLAIQARRRMSAPGGGGGGCTVPAMTAASRGEGEIPFEQVPERWAEVVDRAVQDAADLALCRDVLHRLEDDPRPMVAGDEARAFLQEIADRA